MSNASNLSTLANVLDDGTSGQFLKSTGSGGVAFDTVAAGATVYSSASDLPLTGNTVGDMAYVSAATTAKVVNQATGSVSTEDATRLYIYSGTGWYSVAFITQNPTISTVQDAGGGSAPFTLATDGTTATVVTITANDPESVPLTYSYSVTSGSLNGCTITGADGTSARVAGTAYTDNVFTVTPHASQDATFTLTFTASDGINQATSANAFSLTFVTVVADSNHTTLLATATGTSDNNNITDSSSNSHSITVTGDAYAGSFSPHRSGGYATSFSRSNSSKLEIASMPAIGSGDCSIECWINIESSSTEQGIIVRGVYNSVGGFALTTRAAGGELMLLWSGSIYVTSGANIVADKWHWIQVIRSSGTVTIYVNGSSVGSWSNSSNVSSTSTYIIGRADSYFGGQIRDLRISTNAQSSSNGSEKLATDSNTTFLSCHLPYLSYATSSVASNSYSSISGTIKTVPFSPYDYEEYSATDHGGSVYFDGAGDRIEMAGHSSLVLDTSDFTLEFWYKHVANVTTMRFFGNNYQNSTWGGGRWTMGIASGKLVFQVNSLHGTGSQTASTVNIDDGFWHHCSLTRNGSTFTLRVDGGDAVTYNNSGSVDGGNSYGFTVGSRGSGNESINGYISDFRIVKGTAVYSGNFTPPTGPLTTTGGTYPSTTNVNTSITASNTSLLIKGTDASIIDKSQGANLKLEGNTTGSTTQVKFSNTKSMYFDGSGDYIQASLTEDNLPNEFTIEGWVYASTVSGPKGIFGIDTTAFPSRDAGIAVFTRGSTYNYDYAFYCNGDQVNSTTPPTANSWQHFALVRDSNNLVSLYLDGSSIASSTISGTVNGSIITIGGYYSSSYLWNGYIQDFRITKGKAHYTANFTPPSAPLEG